MLPKSGERADDSLVLACQQRSSLRVAATAEHPSFALRTDSLAKRATPEETGRL